MERLEARAAEPVFGGALRRQPLPPSGEAAGLVSAAVGDARR